MRNRHESRADPWDSRDLRTRELEVQGFWKYGYLISIGTVAAKNIPHHWNHTYIKYFGISIKFKKSRS